MLRRPTRTSAPPTAWPRRWPGGWRWPSRCPAAPAASHLVTGRPVSSAVTRRPPARPGGGPSGSTRGRPPSWSSAGARRLLPNRAAVEAFGSAPVDVIHVAGPGLLQETGACSTAASPATATGWSAGSTTCRGRSPRPTSWSRARAGRSSSWRAIGRPSILAPYPHATADHQAKNARWLAEAGAAVVLPDDECTGDHLRGLVGALLSDRHRLEAMAEAARAAAGPRPPTGSRRRRCPSRAARVAAACRGRGFPGRPGSGGAGAGPDERPADPPGRHRRGGDERSRAPRRGRRLPGERDRPRGVGHPGGPARGGDRRPRRARGRRGAGRRGGACGLDRHRADKPRAGRGPPPRPAGAPPLRAPGRADGRAPRPGGRGGPRQVDDQRDAGRRPRRRLGRRGRDDRRRRGDRGDGARGRGSWRRPTRATARCSTWRPRPPSC